MICHDAYVTQDGYDSGQLFVCDEHGVSEPVMAGGRQSYSVTLDQMIELLYEHAKAVKSEKDAHPLLPLDELKGFSIFGKVQGVEHPFEGTPGRTTAEDIDRLAESGMVEIRELGQSESQYIPGSPASPHPLATLLEQVKEGDRININGLQWVVGERMSAGTVVMAGLEGTIVRYRRGDE